MNQIYVVMSQENFMVRAKGVPVAAYPDYPSALTFAKSIFRPMIGSQENPRDLVFLISISESTESTTTATTK